MSQKNDPPDKVFHDGRMLIRLAGSERVAGGFTWHTYVPTDEEDRRVYARNKSTKRLIRTQ